MQSGVFWSFSAGFSFVPIFVDSCFHSSKHNVYSPLSRKVPFFTTLRHAVIAIPFFGLITVGPKVGFHMAIHHTIITPYLFWTNSYLLLFTHKSNSIKEAQIKSIIILIISPLFSPQLQSHIEIIRRRTNSDIERLHAVRGKKVPYMKVWFLSFVYSPQPPVPRLVRLQWQRAGTMGPPSWSPGNPLQKRSRMGWSRSTR